MFIQNIQHIFTVLFKNGYPHRRVTFCKTNRAFKTSTCKFENGIIFLLLFKYSVGQSKRCNMGDVTYICCMKIVGNSIHINQVHANGFIKLFYLVQRIGIGVSSIANNHCLINECIFLRCLRATIFGSPHWVCGNKTPSLCMMLHYFYHTLFS